MVLNFRTNKHYLFAKIKGKAVSSLITALACNENVSVETNKKGKKVFKAKDDFKINISDGELLFYNGYYAVLETIKS